MTSLLPTEEDAGDSRGEKSSSSDRSGMLSGESESSAICSALMYMYFMAAFNVSTLLIFSERMFSGTWLARVRKPEKRRITLIRYFCYGNHTTASI